MYLFWGKIKYLKEISDSFSCLFLRFPISLQDDVNITFASIFCVSASVTSNCFEVDGCGQENLAALTSSVLCVSASVTLKPRCYEVDGCREKDLVETLAIF